MLGGGAGTTRDTFELVRQSEKYGARVALFGRKILFSEDPEQTLRMMRAVVEGELSSEEAVKAFHAHLVERGIAPKRSLAEDLRVTEPALMHDFERCAIPRRRGASRRDATAAGRHRAHGDRWRCPGQIAGLGDAPTLDRPPVEEKQR